MTGPVDFGQTYRYRHNITDTNGTPANAGTVTVTITKPDGTTATPTVVNSSTGVYDIAYTTSVAGLHTMRGTATGGILGTEVGAWEDVFTVETPGRSFIGVDEASSQLRAAGVITSAADREQLRWLCLVASDAVERDLGRIIARRTVTETYDGGPGAIVLRSSPVISITSVTESGTLLSGTDYVVDSKGILYRGQYGWGWWDSSRIQNVTVTYVAGYADPPRVVRMVALNLVQALWQTSQQAPHPLLDESGNFGEAALPGILAGLPAPLRAAYNRLRSPGVA